MTAFMALALAATLAAQTASKPAACPGDTASEIAQCFTERLDAAAAEMARYAAAARRRLIEEAKTAPPGDKGAAAAPRDFDQAEEAWARYLDAECGAVYDYWSAGDIRFTENLDCQIRLTRLHTHTIWRLWLTYMDSTPPILPEPPLSSDP